jgi:hypothetical protein
MQIAIAIVLTAILLAACGDDTEAQLARCKTDMLAQFDALLVKERGANTNPAAVNFMAGIGRPFYEAKLSELSGRVGLAKCREALAKNMARDAT